MATRDEAQKAIIDEIHDLLSVGKLTPAERATTVLALAQAWALLKAPSGKAAGF